MSWGNIQENLIPDNGIQMDRNNEMSVVADKLQELDFESDSGPWLSFEQSTIVIKIDHWFSKILKNAFITVIVTPQALQTLISVGIITSGDVGRVHCYNS